MSHFIGNFAANDAKSGCETIKKQHVTHSCLLFQTKTGQNPRFSELSIVPQIGKLVMERIFSKPEVTAEIERILKEGG